MKKILVVFLAIFTLLGLASCGGNFEWPDGNLGNMIPRIDGAKGEIEYEHLDSLYITLEDISESQYLDYIEDCKHKGFSVEMSEDGDSFAAFNNDGYKIDISYFSSGDMRITVDAPISMSSFDWPDYNIAKLLPKPDSNYGKIEWEAEYGFVIYVGNTTESEYNDYVNDVYALGFTLDCDKGDDYFYADNAEGYSVSLKYEGFNTMFIRIDRPNEEKPEANSGNNNSNNNSSSNNTSINQEVDYESKILFPETTGKYEYYSYGYHWSTVTVSNYDYDIGEQSDSQIRIDFNFNCTFDYHGENAAGVSFNFYILVYDSDGVLIKDSIVNETDAVVGDTVITKHTILIDKEDVKKGIVIKFSGNK